MAWGEEQQLAQLREELAGLKLALQVGFEGVKKDVHYLAKLYIPLTAVAIIALILALLALFMSVENRYLILGGPTAPSQTQTQQPQR